MNSNYDPSKAKPIYKATQIVWYALYIILILLAFRFILRLLEANPQAGFTRLIYGASRPFIEPFLNVFPLTEANGGIFEWPTLLAMIVYWLIAYALIRLLLMGQPVSTYEAKEKLDKEDK